MLQTRPTNNVCTLGQHTSNLCMYSNNVSESIFPASARFAFETSAPSRAAPSRWRSGQAWAVKRNTAGAFMITDKPWGCVENQLVSIYGKFNVENKGNLLRNAVLHQLLRAELSPQRHTKTLKCELQILKNAMPSIHINSAKTLTSCNIISYFQLKTEVV